MLTYVLIGIALGAATEAAARAAHLWLYRLPWVRALNVVVTFGLIYGGLTWALADRGLPWAVLAGAVLGVVNEIANDRIFKAWHFPGESLRWLRGQKAVIGVGLSWGMVPAMIAFIHGALA